MKNKKIILLTSIITLIAILIIICIAIVNKKNDIPTNNREEKTINVEELEMNFTTLFTNETIGTDQEIIEQLCNIQETETGKYDIDVRIPHIKLHTKAAQEINEKIDNLYVEKIRSIVNGDIVGLTIFKTDYVAYVNENILSIAIKCTLKEGSNPQRIIITTYNYDLKSNRLLDLNDIISKKEIDVQRLESKILEKIESENKKVETIANEGYNVYVRDLDSDIYILENTAEFFLGQDGILYIIYAYGNKNYTSEYDLIITNL